MNPLQPARIETPNRRSRILWLVVAAVLILATAVLLAKPLLAPLETREAPPTLLEVTLTDSSDVPLREPWTYDAAPAVVYLYRVMRTRADGNYAGGCRVTSGLVGTETTRKGVRYHVTFRRGTTTMLDANVVPECYRFFLTEQDEWRRRGLTYQDSYFDGAYRADELFINSFRAATHLAYPPPQ